MMTKDDLNIHPHPLMRAYRLQKQREALALELAGIDTEISQIYEYCKEKGMKDDGEYHLVVTQKTTNKVDPTKFATEFPEANDHFIQLESAYLVSENDRLLKERILRAINIKDALLQVGKQQLYERACIPNVSESITVSFTPNK